MNNNIHTSGWYSCDF